MASSKSESVQNTGVLIQENVSLQSHNTLAVPVDARYFCRAESVDQLNAGLNFAKERQLAIMILGEGSNTVFTKDFDGLVLLNRIGGIRVIRDTNESVDINVAAGENWHEFVDYCITQGWYGLENLALIPGLVGAAPIQNIGAYGVEVKDTIQRVSYIDLDTGKTHIVSKVECQFHYRDSIFKNQLNAKTAIISVDFRLNKKPIQQLSYPALVTQYGSGNAEKKPSPRDVFNLVCKIRSEKLPMPKDIPNAGSFFKNPLITQTQFETLKLSYPEIVGYKMGDDIKLAAAWLIEQRGWKLKEVAGVKVHEKQSLVVTNVNHKSGSDILLLAKAIQQDIAKSFNVELEIEPRIY